MSDPFDVAFFLLFYSEALRFEGRFYGGALFFEFGLIFSGFWDEKEDAEQKDARDDSEDDDRGWFHILIIGALGQQFSCWKFGEVFGSWYCERSCECW